MLKSTNDAVGLDLGLDLGSDLVESGGHGDEEGR